jgi:hypothetical protein
VQRYVVSTSPLTTSCPRRRPGSPAGRHVRRPASRGFDGGIGSREAAEEFVRDDPFVNEGLIKAWTLPSRHMATRLQRGRRRCLRRSRWGTRH